jgi:ketosteroid isomerase-like protein
MKSLAKVFIALNLSLIILSCQHKPNDDPEKVKQVLPDYFDGIKTKDFQKMKDVTTVDFVLFEDGKVFNNDSLINLINSFPKYSVDYTFSEFNIAVDQEIAHIYYHNQGAFILNDTTHMNYKWLESASFRKVNDQWKMNFLHSTVKK